MEPRQALSLLPVVLVVALAVQLQVVMAQKCSVVVSGGGSGSQLASSLLATCGKGCGNTKYVQTTALRAIIEVLSGLSCTTLGDTAMTAVQERSGLALKFGKLTLPIALSSYGVFAGGPKSANPQMNWKDSYNVYSNAAGARDWSKYDKTGNLKGTITVYARLTGAGQNSMMKKFWTKGNNGKVLAGTSPIDSVEQFPKGWGIAQYFSSVQTICSGVKNTAGSIGYAQIAFCDQDGIVEVALKNAAGVYLRSGDTAAVVAQALPRTIPGRDKAWSGFDTIFGVGAKTPALVSPQYNFLLSKGFLKGSGKNGQLAKAIATYFSTNSKGNLLVSVKMDPIGPNYLAGNIAAIKKFIQ